jgi:gamma-glutamyltranspeptidase/glutathione hydrolase
MMERRPRGEFRSTACSRAVIATSNPIATQVGLAILKRGGTAIDAALAASFGLGVVEPFHSGIGGGGFLLVYLAGERRVVTVDARGVAPASATENMYVESGAVRWQDTVIGHRSVLVPGLLSGLGLAHRLAGSMPMAELVEPAAVIAEAGFPVSPIMADRCNNPITQEALKRNPEASRVYMPLGRIPQAGEQLRNPDLAQSYRMIGQEGPEVFYRGRLASLIAEDMAANGGGITKEDLATYRARIVEPLAGTYR